MRRHLTQRSQRSRRKQNSVFSVIFAISVLILVSVFSANAQQFEVTSIKQNKLDSNRVNMDLQPGGRFVASNVSLQVLISVAYGESGPLPPNRVKWNETWIGGMQSAGD